MCVRMGLRSAGNILLLRRIAKNIRKISLYWRRAT
ncbi:UNVERIFIED_CONTAM: hypothetical protein GTU68_016603 [Idotea baltica]|nr:hypothetical protein [Idotea baltica]